MNITYEPSRFKPSIPLPPTTHSRIARFLADRRHAPPDPRGGVEKKLPGET